MSGLVEFARGGSHPGGSVQRGASNSPTHSTDGLSDETIALLRARMRPVHLRRGERLFVEGEAGSSVYFIARGRMKITQAGQRDHEIMLALLGPGELFGEMSLLDGLNRDASAHAASEAELLELRRPEFDDLLSTRPDVTAGLLRHLARRLRGSNDVVADLVFADVPSRVARVLLDLADRFGDRTDPSKTVIPHGLTQSELAQLVGAVRESVNRTLSRFVQRGWLEVEPGRIVILRTDRLLALLRR